MLQSLWRTVWGLLKKKLQIELPYDPAILLLSMYLEKTIIHSNRYMYPNVHCSTVNNS